MGKITKKKYLIKYHILTGILGIVTSLFIIPPIFSRLFAMDILISNDVPKLWLLSPLILILSYVILTIKKKKASRVFLIILLLINIELITRITIVLCYPQHKYNFIKLAKIAYPELIRYSGHPFLHFTGNPDLKHNPDDVISHNNLGFNDHNFIFEKPENTIRIACIGGSTTVSGYPQLLGHYLNKQPGISANSFEPMNFGQDCYTTAHSLVNFTLNIIDFSPDYLVIHHAWNEALIRVETNKFRNDYSHALKPFSPPTVGDRDLIRISVIYRYLRERIVGKKHFLRNAIWKNADDNVEKDPAGNISELKPYKRNIKTIIDLSILKGIKVVLTTQPHSTDPAIKHHLHSKHIDQCNDILREIHEEYTDKIIFVDLDKTMSSKMNNVFEDVAHVNKAGKQFKAEQIGNAILKDHENIF
ncbi:MAG: SGNH/GDSL hydrolase family protein [PVC group bacterium]|nr:SGNH/GDSL hydrolase family protein [PVC group bacterium]